MNCQKRTETQIRCTLLKLFHEKKYWDTVGILMEIFKELEDEGAQDLLVILNSERTMVWKYVGESAFNMLVLVGAVKMSDRISHEIFTL